MQSAHAQILQQLTPAARARLVRADEEDLVRVGGRGIRSGHARRVGESSWLAIQNMAQRIIKTNLLKSFSLVCALFTQNTAQFELPARQPGTLLVSWVRISYSRTLEDQDAVLRDLVLKRPLYGL